MQMKRDKMYLRTKITIFMKVRDHKDMRNPPILIKGGCYFESEAVDWMNLGMWEKWLGLQIA